MNKQSTSSWRAQTRIEKCLSDIKDAINSTYDSSGDNWHSESGTEKCLMDIREAIVDFMEEGGGSSGGDTPSPGAFIVHITTNADPDDPDSMPTLFTFDKTWAEIKAAADVGPIHVISPLWDMMDYAEWPSCLTNYYTVCSVWAKPDGDYDGTDNLGIIYGVVVIGDDQRGTNMYSPNDMEYPWITRFTTSSPDDYPCFGTEES